MQRPYFTAPRISVSEKHRYKIHLDSIRLPLKKINDEAPPLPGSTYIKPGILEKDSLRLSEIERENRNLVRRINVIGRTKGKVDCAPTFLLGSTNYVERKRKNEKIERLNLQLYNRFQTAKSKYNKDEFIEDYKHLKKKFIEKPDHVAFKAKVAESLEWTIAPANIDKSLLDPSKRIRCFFDIAVKGKKKMGRLVMEIWMDVAPVAGCNFVQLCKGYGEYSYKKTPFHRIIKDTFCVGGDVVNKSGTGIFSVYGGVNSTYSDENTTLEFNGPGVLAAHTVFAGDNHSQFLITFQKLTTMNKYFVVFGRIIGSIRTLELIHGFGTGAGKPTKELIIADCGVLGYTSVPNPKTITLPERISPASSEDELAIYKKKIKPHVDPCTRKIREHLIKESRNELKAMNVPCHKLNMVKKTKLYCKVYLKE